MVLRRKPARKRNRENSFRDRTVYGRAFLSTGAAAEKTKARIDAGTGEDMLKYVQDRQARTGSSHAGLGCFYAACYADGLRTRPYSEKGQEGTEIFVLIKRQRQPV